ncbi:MAG: glutathione S-transferase [Paracoccaceae bacterium]
MQLYTSHTTPFGRKVVVALHEFGLTDQVELLTASGTPLDAGSMPVGSNPLGKIPALLREDGGALYDSPVICRYLDQVSGGKLYPAAPALWDTLVIEATADGILDAAVLMIYEIRLRPEELRFAPWVEGQWAKIARSLDAIEAGWMAHLGGPLDMGHIAIGCALGYLDFRHDARGWREGRPRLAAWEAEFAERPSMQATRPPAA